MNLKGVKRYSDVCKRETSDRQSNLKCRVPKPVTACCKQGLEKIKCNIIADTESIIVIGIDKTIIYCTYYMDIKCSDI